MKARVTNTKAKTKWHLSGLYLDSCNCDWGCPCQFNANPTHGNCEGLSAIHITEGKYGNVKLDRLNFIWVASWPGPIHQGHGKASIYIDNRASEEQFNKLSMIITGRAKGSAFDVYRTTLDHFEEPKLAKMTFQLNRIRSQIKVEGVGESQLEPIKNPATGKPHQASYCRQAALNLQKWTWRPQGCLSQMMDTFTLNMKAPMGAFRKFHGKELDLNDFEKP